MADGLKDQSRRPYKSMERKSTLAECIAWQNFACNLLEIIANETLKARINRICYNLP